MSVGHRDLRKCGGAAQSKQDHKTLRCDGMHGVEQHPYAAADRGSQAEIKNGARRRFAKDAELLDIEIGDAGEEAGDQTEQAG